MKRRHLTVVAIIEVVAWAGNWKIVILCGSWISFRKVAYPGIQLMTQNGIGDGAIMEAEEWKGERVLHKPSQTSVVSSLLCY